MEKQLKETKQTFGKAILTLVDRIKTLEATLKRKTKRVILSDYEEEETKAQGRKTRDLDLLVSLVQELVTPSKTVNGSREEQVEDISPTTLEAAAILTKVQKIKSAFEEVNTGGIEVLFGIEKVNAGSLDVNTGIDPVTTDSIRVSIPSPDRGRREGKAPMIEEETQASRKTKEQILQEKAGLAKAIKLYALEKALKKEEVAKQDTIRAKLKANAELKEIVLGKDLTGEVYAKRMVEFGKFEGDWRRLHTKTAKKLKFDEKIARKGFHTDHDRDEYEDSDEANEKDDSTSGRKGVYQIVRENGTDMVYISFRAMLTDILRDDLTELYRIVMKKHGMNEPEDEFEKVLWEYLKNMFEEPLVSDSIWRFARSIKDILLEILMMPAIHCLKLESAMLYANRRKVSFGCMKVCKAMLDTTHQGGKPDRIGYKF
ncbi:hypothetical protein Tco_1354306 [Tanacetum coccineum]